MNPPASLTLVDTATGEVVGSDPRIAELEAEVEELKAAVVHESKVNSGLRAQISRMRGDRIEQAQADPLAERVHRIADAWKILCNHGRCVIDDPRFAAPMAALKRREKSGRDMDEAEEELMKALFGAAQFPYQVPFSVSPTGRAEEKGKRGQRKDDLEYIFRHEKQIAMFTTLAQDHGERILQAMVRPLVHEYGQLVSATHDPWSNEIEEWWSPCPLGCEAATTPLRLKLVWRVDGGRADWVDLRCAGGCEPSKVRDRLREMAEALRTEARAA